MDIAEAHLTIQERIQFAVSRLPTLTKEHIPADDSCPICLNPFDAIWDGKTQEEPKPDAPDSESNELAGVTKLVGCGHIFCKACLVEWIRGRHGNCPSCRRVFSSLKPPSDSDNESSDGDYVPGDDEEDDEDDGFFDSDGFMETESVFDDMDVEDDLSASAVDMGLGAGSDFDVNLWEEEAANVSMEDSNWGLSDGASDSVSEVEGMTMSGELIPENDDAAVYSDRGEGSGSIQVPQGRTTAPK